MSKWTDFVKEYATKNNIKYREAMKRASPEYRKRMGIKAGGKGSPSKTKPNEIDFSTKKGGVRKTARRAYTQGKLDGC